ncbi:MAG TPA: hypothetical protein VGH77_27080 [Streptosporangiaceae bacterium]|jgi:hypothetical protein
MSSDQITHVRQRSLTPGATRALWGPDHLHGQQVHAWMRGGDDFFTYSPSTARWTIV